MNMDVNAGGWGPLPKPYETKTSPVAGTAAGANTDVTVTADSVRSTKELRLAELHGERIPISEEQLIKAIDKAFKAIDGPATSLDFSIHKETKQIMVKVLNKDTGEVIREIPPEKTLDLVAKMWEMAGIFVDERG